MEKYKYLWLLFYLFTQRVKNNNNSIKKWWPLANNSYEKSFKFINLSCNINNLIPKSIASNHVKTIRSTLLIKLFKLPSKR